jgi:hypothetical protein
MNGATPPEHQQLKHRRHLRGLATVVVASTLVAACSGTIRNVNAVKFDGHYFAGRASKSSADPHGFSVRIRNAAKSIAGAREAARYEATIYCIQQFGTSDIIWSIGPDDEAISLSNRSLTLAGRCDPE